MVRRLHSIIVALKVYEKPTGGIMVQRERNLTISVIDRPIERPSILFPDDFVRNIESKLTTKRLPKLSDVQSRGRCDELTNKR